MLVCGVTGPSGAGKGYFCSLLASPEIYIIDTDAIYREMTAGPSDCMRAIEARFGSCVVKEDGSLDRKALASIVFNDRGKLTVLNSITHPFISERCRDIIEEKRAGGLTAVLVDAPLLFEAGLDGDCDLVIAVVGDEEERIRRITERDGITREVALERLSNQHSNGYYSSRADITVVNNGDAIYDQAKKISEIIKESGRI